MTLAMAMTVVRIDDSLSYFKIVAPISKSGRRNYDMTGSW